MKKKLALLLLLPAISFADINEPSSAMDLTKLPQPNAGIKVISRSKMDFTPAENQSAINELNQFKLKGYVEQESTYPRQLLSMKYKASMQIKENASNKDPYDTHMKGSPADIKLAFPFKGFLNSNDFNAIGYAAIGSWKNGWTGIKVFFENKTLGTCAYSLNNMTLNHGSVYISGDSARYDINKKPNILTVKGTVNSGFIYDIGWYDKTFSKELECANMNYDPKITKKLVEVAKNIESIN
jgi:hypothetical protein